MKASEFKIPTDWPLNPREMTNEQLTIIHNEHNDEMDRKGSEYSCDCGFCMTYWDR